MKTSKAIQNFADEKNVKILTHNVIYTLLEQLKVGKSTTQKKHTNEVCVMAAFLLLC